MARFAKVEILLTTLPIADEAVSIAINGAVPFISEIAKAVRSVPGQFQIGVDVGQSSEFLEDAIFLDYEPGGNIASYPIVTLSDLAGLVTIEALTYGNVFTIEDNPSWANITIIPEILPEEVFEIDQVTIAEADGVDKCANARYDFTVKNDIPTDFPVQITSPVSKSCADASELFFDYERFPVPAVSLAIESDLGTTDSRTLINVSTYSFTSVGVVEAFAGATITLNTVIVNSGDQGITRTYSIDDITYYSGNIFYGITAGVYTAYVLDDFGCKQELPFEVIGVVVNKPEPIFEISNANSLKFWKDTDFSPCGETPNFDNAPINLQKYYNTEEREYYQMVQQCDIRSDQIRTNYETVTAEVYNCDGDLVQTPVVDEKRTYINQKDKRDLKIKAGSIGKTNVYYPGGNLYIPDTSTIDGEYSNPTLQLPDYADDGTIASGIYLTLSDNAYLNGDFLVNGKVYDDVIDGWALEVTGVYTSPNESEDAIGQSLYNAEDWNTLEFIIAWSLLAEGHYYVIVQGTDEDPRYEDILWYSEPIDNRIEHPLSTYITYTNTTNIKTMDYSTAIVNFLRIPARFVKHRDGGEIDNFDSDDGTKVQTRGLVTNEVALEVAIVPQYVKDKISIASIHDNLTINNQVAKIIEKAEQEDLLADQNRFYKIEAWYQVGDPLEITDDTGLTTSGNVLGVGGGDVLGVGGNDVLGVGGVEVSGA